MRYYINLVRILTKYSDGDLSKNIERLRKCLYKYKVKYFYMVSEISPNELKHIHAILIFETKEQQLECLMKINKSRLKAYIDKTSIIHNDSSASNYYRYINKQFIKKDTTDEIKRIKYQNYNFCENKEYYNFDDLEKINFVKSTETIDIFVND